jgi:hypothetical protein
VKRVYSVAFVAGAVGLAFLANTVLAERGPHGQRGRCADPIPQDRQTKLLEQFGDKGIDANKDGSLTCDEVKAFFQANPQLAPWRHGRGPGGPPRECTDPIPQEGQARLLGHFADKGIDTNKDGTLTCEEVKAFFQANPQLAPSRHGRGPGGPPRECADPIPQERQAQLLEHFGDKGIDANKDGTLTCDEVKAFFQANPQLAPGPHGRGPGGPPPVCADPIPQERQAKLLEHFGDKGIDANKDSGLTCDEVKAFFQANPELRPGPHGCGPGGPPPPCGASTNG